MTEDSTPITQVDTPLETHNGLQENTPAAGAASHARRPSWWAMPLLVLIMGTGLALRMLGIFWGEYQYLHPDERFLLMVGSSLSPTKVVADPQTGEAQERWLTWGEYFNTEQSTLNPNNVGYDFYVYGTLPMFLTRIAVELFYEQNGLTEMTNAGRTLSALFDLLSIWVVFLIAEKLYKQKVGLLAAAFYALAVLPIQQSHFFTTDTFISFFTLLAVYMAVCVSRVGENGQPQAVQKDVPGGLLDELAAAAASPLAEEASLESLPEESGVVGEDALAAAVQAEEALPDAGRQEASRQKRLVEQLGWFVRSPFFGWSVAFGLALGCAVASKLNAAPVAVMLPAAFGVWLYSRPREQRERYIGPIFAYLLLAAFVSLLTFRIAQPYAFSGPGFLDIMPNRGWVEDIVAQRAQASGDVDFPPAIQWAQRPVWFSAKNLTVWGLGLPLGLLAWAGFLWAGWRMLAQREAGAEWKRHALLWGWTFLYFAWQSIQSNPTMRYQLPIYPTLAIFAAWAVFGRQPRKTEAEEAKPGFNLRLLTVPVGAVVLVATALYAWNFVHDVYLTPITRIAASRWIFQNIPGAINLRIQQADAAPGEEAYNQPLAWYRDNAILPGQPAQTFFTAATDGVVEEVYLHNVTGNGDVPPGPIVVRIASQSEAPGQSVETSATPETDAGGLTVYHARFEQGFPVVKDQAYNLAIDVPADGAAIRLHGSAIANEGAWDDPIPLRVDGYDAYGGIYQGGLEFNMYDDDNTDKRVRMQRILDEADYILISSNRQWGSLQQIPQRFPLSLAYYRSLIGCPQDKNLFWCYAEAKPGMFTGELGFDLVATFESPITIGPLTFNDQFAEEAFSVYDHPKVHIFKKNAGYDPQKTAEILNAVDLSLVVHVTPKKAGDKILTLLLPERLWEKQLAGGTWSELFSYDALLNRFPALGLIVWYLAVMLLGWIAYPFVRMALPGLQDRGYPLSRMAGLVLLAWMAWMGGSSGIPYTRSTITLCLALILLLGGVLAYVQRKALKNEWQEKRGYFLAVEGLFLAFFVFDLLIRLGNPDLWHAYKGGEKPMDFAYFNALIKSTVFPPYDPWFAGGYLNYYYYGFMIASVMVKWLGIVPSIAYNLLLPTWFAMTAMGAFSVAWNLVAKAEAWRRTRQANIESAIEAETEPPVYEIAQVENAQVEDSAPEALPIDVSEAPAFEGPAEEDLQPQDFDTNEPSIAAYPARPVRRLSAAWIAGLAAAIVMVVLGNLATPGMIANMWARMVVPAEEVKQATALQFIQWAGEGALKTLGGQNLPIYSGDLYWIPSRVIPFKEGEIEPITEFPFFTFLYADPHAHLWVQPIALLALAWVASFVLHKGAPGDDEDTPSAWWAVLGRAGIRFFLGGLVIGALWPTNTWDFPAYLAVAACVVAYTQLRYFDAGSTPFLKNLPRPLQRLLAAVATVGLLAALSLALYGPYREWYGAGYTKVAVWKGSHTPLSAYFTHWGLFLFVLISWLAWEARHWMAATPLSSLRKLAPYQAAIYAALALLFALMAFVTVYFDAHIGWFVLLLVAWAGVLVLRPDLPEAKRLALFLFGTGLAITLFVEIAVLVGDVGRMNTVFKFYLQAWTIFAVCAGAALGWLWQDMPHWLPAWRTGWRAVLAVLVVAAGAYTIVGGMAKIKDRMVESAPHTLDGMTYMKTATYASRAGELDLNQDYLAIRWMQENVQGSPVIVESGGEGIQYDWFSRFAIYTGLPDVVGWQWHQEQQRTAIQPNPVALRGREVRAFYETTDRQAAFDFLDKYRASYIVVGQLERGFYPGPGLDKFDALNGDLWQEVYRDREMVIYEVLR
ncbi:MAG: DUF2298 domain-containing protein [Chloroflexota bacterium]